MNKWLIVESYKNWKTDYDNNFKFIGIDESKIKNKNLQTGDLLITYISKVKKISDVRRVIDTNLCKTPDFMLYDRNFPNSLKTELIKLLDENDWIPFSNFSKELELFAFSRHPGLILLNAPVKISNLDFSYLADLIKLK